MENKKGITITNVFQKVLDEYNCKSNKILLDKGDFYNISMKSFLQDSDIEMHSTNNEGKSVVNEPIKMKPVDVTLSTYIDFDVENNKKDPKFEVVDHVRISKYKNILAKGYVLNWSKDVFVIKQVAP